MTISFDLRDFRDDKYLLAATRCRWAQISCCSSSENSRSTSTPLGKYFCESRAEQSPSLSNRRFQQQHRIQQRLCTITRIPGAGEISESSREDACLSVIQLSAIGDRQSAKSANHCS